MLHSHFAYKLLILINKFHNILNPAIKYFAKGVNGIGADAFIAFKAGELSRAYVVVLNKGILGYIFFFHGVPQAGINNQ